MSRFSRGWLLTKQSWSVLKADRSLFAFPVIAGLSALLAALVFFAIGGGLLAATDQWLAVIPVAVIAAYLLTFISIFFSVALAACASRALDGEQTTAREGIAAASKLVGPIMGWAGVQLVVGSVISLIQGLLSNADGVGQIVGAIVGGLANMAWTIATFFVIPVIALEGLGPKEALTRSLHVIKERWGEGVAGSFAVGGILFLVAFLPAILLIGGGVALLGSSEVGGGSLIGVGAIIFIVGVIVQASIMSVFRVALFRYATTGEVLGPFQQGDLLAAFRTKKRRGLR